ATIIAHESHLAELTTPSVLFYDKWPSVRLHSAPPETVVEDSRLKCTMDTCLNWNHCPLGDFFKFCALGHSAIPSTVFYALMDSPHYVGECKSVSAAACLEIAHNLESALNCSVRIASNIHRTCLVILVELDSLRKLFEQIHHESGRSHTIIAASHFPQHLFRPDFDFVFPASLKPLVDIAGDNTGSSSVRLVPGRRPILLALRVGRSTSAHSVSLSSFESVFLKATGTAVEPVPVSQVSSRN
ncbi:unnamed protein product, partial [Dicrocoelium dendriticum]